MKNCVGGSESIQCHQDTDKWFSRACAPASTHSRQTKRPHHTNWACQRLPPDLPICWVWNSISLWFYVSQVVSSHKFIDDGFLSTDVFPVSLFCCLSSDWEAFLWILDTKAFLATWVANSFQTMVKSFTFIYFLLIRLTKFFHI